MLHSRKYLEKYRKQLRNNMTYSEVRLWSCLKNKQLKGRRFRRQHSIGDYIVDFFCYSENLVIEVDGDSHNNPASQQNDAKRDQFLVDHGFKVIRIEALDIKDNIEGVLKEISDCFHRDQ
jgi:very-short-patch-repair endonuclease